MAEMQVAVAAAGANAAATNVGSEDQEALHGWHLTKKEAEHVSEIADMYRHMGLTPYPPEIPVFKVEQSHGMLGNYYRAYLPVSHSDIHMPDVHTIGFLGKESNSLSVSLRNYKLTQINEEHPHDRHSAASLVVNEFHHFVKKLGTLMQPNDDCLTELTQRVGLIETFITRCHISMHKYRPFLSIMVRVKEQLQQILNIWPAFQAQQKLQEKIRAVKLHVDAALLRLLGYSFYVLKCEPGDFSFDPQDWHPAIEETESVHCKIMHWLMLQDHVYNACTNHSVDRSVWMKQLMATGYEGDILHQMNEAWTDPDAMSEPVLQLGDMRGDVSGLPSKVFAHETDMSPEQRRSAIQLWLTLVREAVGFAMGAQMMDHAYTLSCMGGELLIARQTSKDLALSTLKFVRNRLAEVSATMISLDRIMLPVLAAGKMKNSENYLWNNVAFTNWARNYEYAKTHCAPGILTHAHEARQTIVDLESEIADLDVAHVEKKIGDVGKSLISLCKSSCQLFNEPHALTVDELPPLELALEPEPVKEPEPKGTKGALGALQDQLDRESACLSSGSSLRSVGYLSSRSRSWIPVTMLSPVEGPEFAKFILRVTLESPEPATPVMAPPSSGSMLPPEPDTRVVEFWKRMRFEDLAELVQLMAPDEPVLSVAAGGLGSVLGIERFGELLLQVPEAEEKAQRASLSGLLALPRREQLSGVRRCLAELEQDLLQRVPPGHAQTLTRELALGLDPSVKRQELRVGSLGFPGISAQCARGLVTLVRLDLHLEVSGRCCINARLQWSAQLTVLTLPSLKELVARVCALFEQSQGPGPKSKEGKAKDGVSSSSPEFQKALQEELSAFVSSGTDLMRKRFSPARYPEVQQWLQRGYSVQSVQAEPLQEENCAVS